MKALAIWIVALLTIVVTAILLLIFWEFRTGFITSALSQIAAALTVNIIPK
jgi:hypothetical protein